VESRPGIIEYIHISDLMKRKPILALISTVLLMAGALQAQNSVLEYQKSYGRVSDVFKRKEDTLCRQFEARKLPWPVSNVYIRSFKYDSELEVWVRSSVEAPYKLFKTYRVCALAGSLGPKRMEGDYQVPEGFYHINEFKHNSAYHLSLGLNYPNASDRILSDSLDPGGDIYIHGSCVTTGCIPITNPQIEELYIIALHAYNAGQDYIPVHIFPVRYDKPNSVEFLEKSAREDASLKRFSEKLRTVFDHFEKNRTLPAIAVNPKGEYVVL
jgi:murein L,D-transpeptidase YafK